VHGIREAPIPPRQGARRTALALEPDDGPHASPKAYTALFGIVAVAAGIPLNLVQRWLGHTQLSTTAIYNYANAVGARKEKDIARRM
jgi:integrase/recombinase XerD